MGWAGGLIEWAEEKKIFISVVFSWQMEKAYQRVAWHRQLGYEVIVGGPAVYYEPEFFEGIAEIGASIGDIVFRHNFEATNTTIGCIRNCAFCIVPKIEPQYIELDDFPVRPIVCDDNFLASSRNHFDRAIDKLKQLDKPIDFNQGLDARLLTNHQADRLAELRLPMVRLAWDHIGIEEDFLRSFNLLIKAGIPTNRIRSYILIGFNDTPEDALYRLQTVKDLGAMPNPMRYQPLDVKKRNQYVGKHWNERLLRHYMRYWSRQVWLKKVPFEEYEYAGFSLQ